MYLIKKLDIELGHYCVKGYVDTLEEAKAAVKDCGYSSDKYTYTPLMEYEKLHSYKHEDNLEACRLCGGNVDIKKEYGVFDGKYLYKIICLNSECLLHCGTTKLFDKNELIRKWNIHEN